jgi:hypothetical protein
MRLERLARTDGIIMMIRCPGTIQRGAIGQETDEETVMNPPDVETVVECYAGYRGDETPRAVVVGGQRCTIACILSRERVLDPERGLRREVWHCRLEDGRAVTIELLGTGTWRVLLAS